LTLPFRGRVIIAQRQRWEVDFMICGIGDYGCGCEELVQLGPKKSPPVTEEAELCGYGSCGCGCGDFLEEKENNLPG